MSLIEPNTMDKGSNCSKKIPQQRNRSKEVEKIAETPRRAKTRQATHSYRQAERIEKGSAPHRAIKRKEAQNNSRTIRNNGSLLVVLERKSRHC